MPGDTNKQSGRTARLQRQYADVVVRVGLNVQPAQLVMVRCLVEHAGLARAVAEAAYAAGARLVEVDYQDDHVRRAGIAHGAARALAEGSEADRAIIDRMEREGAAFVRLTGNPDPHLMDDLDPAAVVAAEPLGLAQRRRDVLQSGAVQWCVAAAPNAGWARVVFGEPDVERLWEAVGQSVRLDEADPVAAWRDHVAMLRRRAEALTAHDVDALHYEGPGTDLTVGLPPGARWAGGALSARSGVDFVPNLPTEEVFTSPDPSRADGTVAITRPLVMPTSGIMVEGLRLTLRGGRIVDVTAVRGAEAVRSELASHPNAARLGEVALVDRWSRVGQTGVVFHDTLYDENAGAHIAWGQGIAMCLPEGAPIDRVNQAPVHTDVVVGGPEMSITGIAAGGRRVPIIEDDTWVLPV